MIFTPRPTQTLELVSRVAEDNLHQFAGFGNHLGDGWPAPVGTSNDPGSSDLNWWQQGIVGWTNPAAAIALIDALRRPKSSYPQPLSNYTPFLIGGIALVAVLAITMRR